MPLALLLSPDDQAVSAITGVLEEMSVTCERPLDGVSAAQLLNSHTFDLVLVDCENLPAAKLIFDVCRRGKNGSNPVPIAIVDGRAGLPTAFRLGAELILTKPVAKDQARTTIRTAVGRVRKDVPAAASVRVQAAAAAAAAGSSPTTQFADPASADSTPDVVASSAVSADLSVAAAKMHSAIDAAVDAHKVDVDVHVDADADTDADADAAEIAAAVHSKPVMPLVPSDDPVLAELERTELEESESAKSAALEEQEPSPSNPDPQKAGSQNKSSDRLDALLDHAAAKSASAPVLSAAARPQKKRGPLVALMTLAIAVGALYGAWMYEPGFRAIAQPQIDRVLALAGAATSAAHSPNTAKIQPVRGLIPTPAPTPIPTSDLAVTPPTASDSTAASAPAPSSSTTSTPVPSTSASSTPIPSPAATVPVAPSPSSAAVAGSKPAVIATNASTAISKPADIKKDAAAATSISSPASAPLPAESTAIILSSQGAQKRLLTSAPPKYPAEARAQGAEGTVVLKAVIDETGKVSGLRLVEGNAALASAAIQAVKRWSYRPYVRDGKSQPFQTVVIVDFQKQ
jgi:TonB family protein